MGGLAAAKALSTHFDRVTVLERDALPPDATSRQGTPQARHLHALLAGGLVALNELLPGIETELEHSAITSALHTSLIPGLIAVTGPLLPADVRALAR